MKYEVKDLNAPSRWNMRIWDDDNGEWLCQSDKDALTYYGFDITGGETTEFQGLPKWHPYRHLVWEQSTGLKDKNGKEIYEGDILWWEHFYGMTGENKEYTEKVYWEEEDAGYVVGDWFEPLASLVYEDAVEVIGNIHENPELLEEDKCES